MRVYFDPMIYLSPVLKVGEDETDGLAKVKTDLERVSLHNGFSLISNGGKHDLHSMKCQSFRIYSNTDNDGIDDSKSNIHQTSLHNDQRNNSQNKGDQALQRRQKTILPMSNDATCPFGFMLSYKIVPAFTLIAKAIFIKHLCIMTKEITPRIKGTKPYSVDRKQFCQCQMMRPVLLVSC